MGASKGNGRRVLQRVLATLAVSDVAYRLLMRAQIRRALGMGTKHA